MKENRGIDHLVVAVNQIEDAQERYRTLGFTVTPVARHPWGTVNSLVQLRGNFLELLAIGDASAITEAGDGEFSFGAFNRDYLREREGVSQLVFEGHDARADREEFSAAGLDTYPNFDFERLARQPDGSEVTVAFSLTFITHQRMPGTSFFTCQQHAPEYFWKPEYQQHANTARLISEVVLVGDEPTRFADFFAGIQGRDAVTATADALTVSTARGHVSVLSPALYADRFGHGVAAGAPDGPHIAGYQISCESLSAVKQCLESAGVPFRGGYDRITLAPDAAFGVALEFVA